MCLLVPEYLYFAFNLVRSSTTVVSFNLLEKFSFCKSLIQKKWIDLNRRQYSDHHPSHRVVITAA